QQFNVQGIATDPNGEILYLERLHRVPGETGGILKVEYSDPKGIPLADKIVDYDCRATTPSFELTDRLNGRKEGVTWTQDLVKSYQDLNINTLDVPDSPSIVDAGFDNAIKLSWDALLAGDNVSFNYLFARENKFLKLRFVKSKPPEILRSEVSGDVVFFRIAANNLIFRILSSPIYVGYDHFTRDLKYYYGPSNLPMMKEQKNVLIRYKNLG
ncbi:MAG: hypothetical protein ACR2QW_16950, partial [bacterium]